MKPKDKAKEIYDAYYGIFNSIGYDNIPNKFAKECAIIVVNEILKAREVSGFILDEDYWKEVKEEIIKLQKLWKK